MLEAPQEDPVVTLEDLAQIRALLFRRWIPTFLSLGLKLLGVFVLVAVGIYLPLHWLNPVWTHGSPVPLMLWVSAALLLASYLLHVTRMLWLDFRIARRLDNMTQRVRAGETVRASEVLL